ncbi:hypothetical protein C8J56DRAFT_194360 [Mycena floridula]|nr:hypothetical protein C8J56DRAFT_194360 [Mycena floridula]
MPIRRQAINPFKGSALSTSPLSTRRGISASRTSRSISAILGGISFSKTSGEISASKAMPLPFKLFCCQFVALLTPVCEFRSVELAFLAAVCSSSRRTLSGTSSSPLSSVGLSSLQVLKVEDMRVLRGQRGRPRAGKRRVLLRETRREAGRKPRTAYPSVQTLFVEFWASV